VELLHKRLITKYVRMEAEGLKREAESCDAAPGS
jgi:hypothetical protein